MLLDFMIVLTWRSTQRGNEDPQTNNHPTLLPANLT